MAEFWIISNYLRQRSFENVEIHKLCKAVAVKYFENEKNHLRANCVREENIILLIDVGNLKQLYEAVTEVIETLSASEALLTEYYDEQIKMTYDVGQQEKIYGYDEIKTELETRELICMYEELYCRKIETSKKMEEREIVKKYRDKEQDLLKTENDCLALEQNLKALEYEIADVQASIQESIFHLVKGSKELEITPTPLSGFMEKKQHIPPIDNKPIDRNLLNKKPGLSSRLSMIFTPAKVPSAIVAHRIQILNPTKGLDRLLQEAEILRKSMQITPEVNQPIARPSIFLKENKKEKPNKKVTFDVMTPEIIPMNTESPSNEAEMTLDTISSHITATKAKPMISNTAKCVILENVVIKPPGAALPIKVRKDEDTVVINEPEVNTKRKIENDHIYAGDSPPRKIKRIVCDTKTVDAPQEVPDSRSFMDMFIDFSEDSTLEKSSISISKPSIDKPCADDKRKPESDDVAVIEDTKQTVSFGGFEEFFAGLTNIESENNESYLPKGENSFDFFEANGNTGDDVDCGEDDFSFKF